MTLTPAAERLAVKLSIYVFNELGLSRYYIMTSKMSLGMVECHRELILTRVDHVLSYIQVLSIQIKVALKTFEEFINTLNEYRPIIRYLCSKGDSCTVQYFASSFNRLRTYGTHIGNIW